jgi:predicted DNA-binding transcriptional regulator AlpA
MNHPPKFGPVRSTNGHSMPPVSSDERLHSPRQVAARLGVSERWVRDHATRRYPRIRAVKLGPLLRFRDADINEFIAQQSIISSRQGREMLK